MSKFLTYVLVGPLAGKTISLSKGMYNFVDGRLETQYTEENIDALKGVTTILGQYYNAHLEGSQALADAQKAFETGVPVGEQDGGFGGDLQTLEEALNSLDPEDEAHWTKGGLPNLKVLSELTGTTVTRADIDAIIPDFNRTVAAEA